MDKKILGAIFVLIFLFSALELIMASDLGTSTQTHYTASFNTVSFTINPITITDNAGLAVYASSGNGNSGNPYIIANYTINCGYAGTNGINIHNTNKYFELRNINISHCRYGFYFRNVTFGSIMNSLALNNTADGFSISGANTVLTHNSAMNNHGYGFSLESFYSNNNILTSNRAINNNNIGFMLWPGSNNNILINNTAVQNIYGFLLYSSFNNTLVDNIVRNSRMHGFVLTNSSNILVNSSNNNTLVHNIATNNTAYGFFVDHSFTNVLTNNTATNNTMGFSLSFSSRNVLQNNTGQYNRLYDYYAINSANNMLLNNTFTSPFIYNSPPPASTSIIPSPSTTYPSPLTNSSSALFTSPFNFLGNLGVLDLVGSSGLVLVGILVVFYSRRIFAHNSVNTRNYTGLNLINNHKPTTFTSTKNPAARKTKTLAINDPSTSITLLENILKESYQAPDYATALKVQQSGFPDYATYKQAQDKSITTYAAWLQHQNNK